MTDNEDRKQMAWAAAYGSTFASIMHGAARVDGWEPVLGDKANYVEVHSIARRVADAAVKGWPS